MASISPNSIITNSCSELRILAEQFEKTIDSSTEMRPLIDRVLLLKKDIVSADSSATMTAICSLLDDVSNPTFAVAKKINNINTVISGINEFQNSKAKNATSSSSSSIDSMAKVGIHPPGGPGISITDSTALMIPEAIKWGIGGATTPAITPATIPATTPLVPGLVSLPGGVVINGSVITLPTLTEPTFSAPLLTEPLNPAEILKISQLANGSTTISGLTSNPKALDELLQSLAKMALRSYVNSTLAKESLENHRQSVRAFNEQQRLASEAITSFVNTKITESAATINIKIDNVASELRSAIHAKFIDFKISRWSQIALSSTDKPTAVFSAATPLRINGYEFWLKVEKGTDGRVGLYICCGEDGSFPITVDYQLMARRYNSDDAVCASVVFRTEFGREKAWGLSRFSTIDALTREGAYNLTKDELTVGCIIYPVRGLNWGIRGSTGAPVSAPRSRT